jgi:hypothetical protein
LNYLLHIVSGISLLCIPYNSPCYSNFVKIVDAEMHGKLNEEFRVFSLKSNFMH